MQLRKAEGEEEGDEEASQFSLKGKKGRQKGKKKAFLAATSEMKATLRTEGKEQKGTLVGEGGLRFGASYPNQWKNV